MSAKINIPFSINTNYTYDDTLVDISGGSAKLKLINDPQAFTQDYSSSTGFTFNTNYTEFSGGQCQQKDLRPANATCWAKFSADLNLNYGGGTLSGTAGGSETIDSGYLKFTGVAGQQVSFSGTNNFTSTQTGCVKFIYRPQYAGTPATNQIIFDAAEADAASTNRISLQHLTNTYLRLNITDSSDVTYTHSFAIWTPTINTDYEIEINYDLTTGVQQLFIDGVLTGTDGTLTLTRGSVGLLRVGGDYSGGDSPNFWIKDFICYDAVQHTATYTPGYTLPVKRYLGDLITLPTFTYAGIGSIQNYTSFSPVETGNIVYNVNNLYWNGSGWVFSNGTAGQMNSASTINTRIGLLPASDTLIVKARTADTNTQMLMSNLEVYHNGQIYPTTNPTVEPINTFNMEQLIGFIETANMAGSDSIKYTLRANGGYLWHNGSAWVSSSGSYSETNTSAEFQANLASFTTSNITFNFKMYLHSNDGTTTPIISNIEVEYDFAGDPEDDIHITSVWFYSRFPDGTADTNPYVAKPSVKYAKYKNNVLVALKEIEITPQANGYTEFELIDTKNMLKLDGTNGITYNIMQGTEQIARIEVDVTTGVLLWDAVK